MSVGLVGLSLWSICSTEDRLATPVVRSKDIELGAEIFAAPVPADGGRKRQCVDLIGYIEPRVIQGG
jgi:hypothetical protein